METHEWGPYEGNDLLYREDLYKGRSIFPIQNLLKLEPMNPEAIKSLKAHCNDLYNR